MRRSPCRSLIGAMVSLLCIGLLLSVVTQSGGITKAAAAPPPPPLMATTTLEGLQDLRDSSRDQMDPLSASKRRVPNGPDPIHNRRAGKSGRPEGRA